jgi:endonuclease/exonuclease/phosphatase family metal-dependent hydrolase
VTFISLYGIWDRDDRYLFSEATLHRAISDLTILLQETARSHVVLAGDLNVFFEWDRADYDAYWAPRYNTIFIRLVAYGLELVGPFGEKPLPGCRCGRGTSCRHVRTFAYQRKPTNLPNQLDYVFATRPMQAVTCCALEDEAAWEYSDHLPVISRFAVS